MHLKKMHKPIEWNESPQSLHLLFSAAKTCTPMTNGRSVEVTMICNLLSTKKLFGNIFLIIGKLFENQLGWVHVHKEIGRLLGTSIWQHFLPQDVETDGHMQVSANADNELTPEKGAVNSSYAWKRMETLVKRADLMMTESLGFSFMGISEKFKQNKLQSTLVASTQMKQSPRILKKPSHGKNSCE